MTDDGTNGEDNLAFMPTDRPHILSTEAGTFIHGVRSGDEEIGTGLLAGSKAFDIEFISPQGYRERLGELYAKYREAEQQLNDDPDLTSRRLALKITAAAKQLAEQVAACQKDFMTRIENTINANDKLLVAPKLSAEEQTAKQLILLTAQNQVAMRSKLGTASLRQYLDDAINSQDDLTIDAVLDTMILTPGDGNPRDAEAIELNTRVRFLRDQRPAQISRRQHANNLAACQRAVDELDSQARATRVGTGELLPFTHARPATREASRTAVRGASVARPKVFAREANEDGTMSERDIPNHLEE